jgi:hypothetical protein
MSSTSNADLAANHHLFQEIGWENLELLMNQQIEQQANQCQIAMQASLAGLWAAAEKERSSLAQRMVSDYLSGQNTNGLPHYHPLHWFQSQLEFQLRGVIEFNDNNTALSSTQEILDQLQQEIFQAIATQQTEITEEFDRQIQTIRQALATAMQNQLQERRVMVTEYINSHVTLAKLQLREVDKFGFFLDGKRINPASIVVSTTKIVSPWYLMGLQEKQQACYRVSLQQLQPVVRESLDRSFQDIKAQITNYIHTNLYQQIQKLAEVTTSD